MCGRDFFRLIVVAALGRDTKGCRNLFGIGGSGGANTFGVESRLIGFGVTSCSRDDRGAGSSTSSSDCAIVCECETFVADGRFRVAEVVPGGGSGLRIFLSIKSESRIQLR